MRNRLNLSVIALCAMLPLEAALAAAPTPTAAPPRPAPQSADERVARELSHLTTLLNLDASQQGKVKTLLVAEESRRESERKAHEAARQEKRRQLEGILTPAQLSKLDAQPKSKKAAGRPKDKEERKAPQDK